jgi:hypothetical protein
MTFDSRRRLLEIKSPTHVVAANDAAVPIHHAKMLRAGSTVLSFSSSTTPTTLSIWERADEF